MPSPLTVAYFTMEVGLKSSMPTFAGGLGILAADLMRSCADLGVKAACMTVCWQHGYLRQTIHHDGSQSYDDMHWNPEEHLKKLPQTVTIFVEGRPVTIGVWVYELAGAKNMVPIYFLDTNLPENKPEDREITHYLYGGDQAMRIRQELVLGIGGVRMLRALGYRDIGTYHMNEGHAAFLTLELLRERDWKDEDVRRSCAFTTHTPVQAGHDVFPYDLASRIAGDNLPWHIRKIAGEDALSMTLLAMHMSRYTCGVSRIHGEVSRSLFPGEMIDAVTNGIHHLTWSSPEMQALFDRFSPGWREDPSVLLETCRNYPDEELWTAHQAGKARLIAEVNARTGQKFSVDRLTIASARRIVPYKQPELLYSNLERLKEVCQGAVQIIHAGNAHPSDPFSQGVIQRMVQRSAELKDFVEVVYLENYNPDLAKLLTQGADIWLNTPMRLHEASGTSGMKACLNGVLNLSTLDGWWIEGYGFDPEAGWRIGPLVQAVTPEEHRIVDAEDIYTQLQYEVIPEYYFAGRTRWIRRMKRAIGLIGFFNAQRCVREYLEKAWEE
ncbi:MAG: alpha-glucan family phosphorylase [Candidatus Peribacteraceae bacterium]|nr:alpha-glucan family phosphorylase [Candidatus Peribacteraceae bacterium]